MLVTLIMAFFYWLPAVMRIPVVGIIAIFFFTILFKLVLTLLHLIFAFIDAVTP